MATVDAECFKWTRYGMHRTDDPTDAYVRVRDVERLLEEIHARVWRAVESERDQAADQVRSKP